jgi:hypothetical protein
MTGCWRLLVVYLLIFVASQPLRGQGAPADRLLVSSPGGAHAVAPVLAPKLSQLIDPLFLAPVGIDVPASPPHDPVPPGTPGLPQNPFQQGVFQQLVHSAGIIFSGRVTAVRGGLSSPGLGRGSTAVTFHVEHAMRGVMPGRILTIHEWAGLWARGERYRVGERVLLFLYGPSKLGFTSPVAGNMGRFALDSKGRVVMGPQQMSVLSADLILSGRTVIPYADFALAVRGAREKGSIEP